MLKYCFFLPEVKSGRKLVITTSVIELLPFRNLQEEDFLKKSLSERYSTGSLCVVLDLSSPHFPFLLAFSKPIFWHYLVLHRSQLISKERITNRSYFFSKCKLIEARCWAIGTEDKIPPGGCSSALHKYPWVIYQGLEYRVTAFLKLSNIKVFLQIGSSAGWRA